MTEAQIKHMVSRFLGWRLPENFNPDDGISFKRSSYKDIVYPMPTGTNLFDSTQVDVMVRHIIEGLPQAPNTVDELALYDKDSWDADLCSGDVVKPDFHGADKLDYTGNDPG